ncbi:MULTISPECIES: phosphonate metabolism transcriptional regulator PhnF [Roseobacteraceae]|uniref:Phosphonates metabolism transcriptional regulator PhnF n=1 Tax=Celeribacter baekdonensis B30 TaxID=1208323 RepID=K2IYV3_9RHOB|nr:MULTISPECIES: phosphonate metabolism transcriptional regulator PhnF [Roseobacteraceae]EKE67702.1 phosphonates metabolism transcriptional regulator PhnF [Celeribacter baekdonensis B30]KAB6715619.1 phosphonate metabolism transcriptional regulator PhnF [Roseobacter sp. TSBP12]|tara:strand:+ start:829 stop:1545 length:717 start_codon:yes stop_codon:yes gene_type:complete
MITQKWRRICDAIEQDIANGTLQPGDRLPTEPELAARYEAGRHSVRRAIAELAREGSVSVEQGRGTFVESGPMLEYAIGTRTRLHRNLNSQGVEVTGELLGAEITAASERVARALGLLPGAPVQKSRRITYADTLPINMGTGYRCAKRFPDFVTRRDLIGSVTETYKSYGITDYLRAETTLHSRLARPEEAKLLRQHPQTPVIVVRAIDQSLDGTALSFSEVIWSALRVKFTMTNERD